MFSIPFFFCFFHFEWLFVVLGRVFVARRLFSSSIFRSRLCLFSIFAYYLLFSVDIHTRRDVPQQIPNRSICVEYCCYNRSNNNSNNKNGAGTRRTMVELVMADGEDEQQMTKWLIAKNTIPQMGVKLKLYHLLAKQSCLCVCGCERERDSRLSRLWRWWSWRSACRTPLGSKVQCKSSSKHFLDKN